MDSRRQKAHELADRASIRFKDGCYFVPSQSGSGTYTVILDAGGALCDCPDFELTGEPGSPCKHILAARLWRDRQARGVGQDTEDTEPSAKPRRPTYAQDWPAYHAAQTAEGRHFQQLLADLCDRVENRPASRGAGAGRSRWPIRSTRPR